MSHSLPYFSTTRLLLHALETERVFIVGVEVKYREAFLRNDLFENLSGSSLVCDDWKRRL
jgi:hypothetical protein